LPPDAVTAAQIEEKAARSYFGAIADLTAQGRF